MSVRCTRFATCSGASRATTGHAPSDLVPQQDGSRFPNPQTIPHTLRTESKRCIPPYTSFPSHHHLHQHMVLSGNSVVSRPNAMAHLDGHLDFSIRNCMEDGLHDMIPPRLLPWHVLVGSVYPGCPAVQGMTTAIATIFSFHPHPYSPSRSLDHLDLSSRPLNNFT